MRRICEVAVGRSSQSIVFWVAPQQSFLSDVGLVSLRRREHKRHLVAGGLNDLDGALRALPRLRHGDLF